MKRIAILIDGGHLRATAKSHGQQTTPRFIQNFALQLRSPDEEIVRILYHDCRPFNGSKPQPVSGTVRQFVANDGWLDELAGLDLFAVRLGTLKWRGWKPRRENGPPPVADTDYKPSFEQKGVDLRIGLDIANFAYEKSVDRIVVVTGDTDLIPAMKLARRKGLQVVGAEFPGYPLPGTRGPRRPHPKGGLAAP